MPGETRLTVLVAEHAKARRIALRRILGNAGFRVFEAATGAELLEMVRELVLTPPDLVLLDLWLPDIDGFEVCRRLKSRPETDHIPVIHTSARCLNSTETIQRYESGSDDCAVQSIPANELLAVIMARIRLRHAQSHRTTRLLQLQADRLETRLARFKAAVEAAQLGIWEFTTHLRISENAPLSGRIRFDQTCRTLLGISEQRPMPLQEVLGYIHGDDRERVTRQMQVGMGLYGSGIFDTECRIVRSDGTERWVSIRAHEARPRVPVSRLVQVVGTFTDITDRKLAEAVLIRSEKVAALGRMAATLAHEINNPLAAVMNALFLARSNVTSPEFVGRYLNIADEYVSEISHITRQALGFYREGSAPEEVSISALLDEALAIFKIRIAAKHVTAETDYGRDIKVIGVRGELRQVFANFITNSLDAIGDSGTIRVRVSKHAARDDSGAYVRVTIADNGMGITAESRAHLFEPLFTTKGIRGTGLGLWVSKQIIMKHNGSVRVRSSTSGVHRGTVFSVLLPVVP